MRLRGPIADEADQKIFKLEEHAKEEMRRLEEAAAVEIAKLRTELENVTRKLETRDAEIRELAVVREKHEKSYFGSM